MGVIYMLLSFEVDGYKLFDEPVCFSMHALKKFKRLQENIYTQRVGNKEYNALKSAIIYGPNHMASLNNDFGGFKVIICNQGS